MCQKNNLGKCSSSIDQCMRPLVAWLKYKHKPVASCCGHGKYPMTLVVKEGITVRDKSVPTGRRPCIVYREIFSGKLIPRVRRFYKKDKEGYYYIPEVVHNEN